jgi:hypothetical protein
MDTIKSERLAALVRGIKNKRARIQRIERFNARSNVIQLRAKGLINRIEGELKRDVGFAHRMHFGEGAV